MKKLLFIGMMCLASFGAFADSNSSNLNSQKKSTNYELNNFEQKKENSSFDVNLIFCTVTYTANIYNEVGVYVGSISETRSVNTGGQYDCVLAYMMAKNAVMEEVAPE